MSDKVVFLDVDGVLNCSTSKSRCGVYFGIDKDKVQRLARIVNDGDAAVVLSSDWRDGWQPYGFYEFDPPMHIRYLNNHLWKKGKIRIRDRTPDIDWSRRGREINAWLECHPYVERYVILDDTMFPDYYHDTVIADHLVLTNYKLGLTDDDVEKALRILND